MKNVDKPMDIEIFLKGGGSFTIQVNKFKISDHSVEWETPGEGVKNRLVTVQPEEIAAVVRKM